MIFVDSSVWIDYFRGAMSPQAERLDTMLGTEPLIIGDIVVTEILQGFDDDSAFDQARRVLAGFGQIVVGGPDIAVQAARNFRSLRRLGITIRKTIDTLIATRCIEKRISLLYSDRDFDPFVRHLGLVSAMAD